MADRTDFRTEKVPGKKLEFFGPRRPPKNKKATTTKGKIKFVKNCGDCEPGGFGSTYGFSPM